MNIPDSTRNKAMCAVDKECNIVRYEPRKQLSHAKQIRKIIVNDCGPFPNNWNTLTLSFPGRGQRGQSTHDYILRHLLLAYFVID